MHKNWYCDFFRAFDHIFETVSVVEGTKYLLHASYCEIYNEEIRDLLGKDVKAKLDLHEHPEKGVYVNGKVFSSENYITYVFCKTLFKVQSAGFKETDLFFYIF